MVKMNKSNLKATLLSLNFYIFLQHFGKIPIKNKSKLIIKTRR